jgi:hypothetical protein
MESSYSKIQKLDQAIKNQSKTLRELRKKKKEEEVKLYNLMKKSHTQAIHGIPIEKLEPKTPKPRTKPGEKKRKALKILQEQGIKNPEKVFDALNGKA